MKGGDKGRGEDPRNTLRGCGPDRPVYICKDSDILTAWIFTFVNCTHALPDLLLPARHGTRCLLQCPPPAPLLLPALPTLNDKNSTEKPPPRGLLLARCPTPATCGGGLLPAAHRPPPATGGGGLAL